MVKLNRLTLSKGGMALSEYDDAGDISSYARIPILSLAQSGDISADGGKLEPLKVATIGEAKAFLTGLEK